MAVETRTVSYYTCDTDSCPVGVYREVEYDGLPSGYHGTVSHVDGEGQATGTDWYACTWDHVPSSMSGAMNARGQAIENHTVPRHHTETGDIPQGSGGQASVQNRSSGSTNSNPGAFSLGGTSYEDGYGTGSS